MKHSGLMMGPLLETGVYLFEIFCGPWMGDTLKRATDILVASVAGIFLFPLLVVVAVLVKLTSKGPALFIQERVGLGCRCFMIYKFRTMVVDAAKIGGYQTQQGDPRITRVGRFLRRSSIDEFPQLLNVIKGDMSLVGPRPDTPMQQANYLPRDWVKRHTVRPGITGLAQVVLRSSGTAAERLRLDLEYVERHTITMDLKLAVKTLGTIMDSGRAN